MNLNKPKFWDSETLSIWSILLLPLSAIYLLILLIKKKIIKENSFNIKIICVGNIYIGGTGKTSLAVTIANILKKNNIKYCFIKKLYPDQYDEQKILQNYGKVFLSRERLKSLKEAEKEKYQFAIFDDGLQDYSINYDLSFVCFNTINWIGNGMIIPSGPLRENIKNLKYYNYIVLNGNLENLELIKKEIYFFNPNIEIIIGKYIPTNLMDFDLNEEYLVFSGIGNHKSFISMLKSYHFKVIKDIEYPDHYIYSKNDINELISISKKLNSKIITTEKDFMRIKNQKENKIQFIKSKLEIIDPKKIINAIMRINETH